MTRQGQGRAPGRRAVLAGLAGLAALAVLGALALAATLGPGARSQPALEPPPDYAALPASAVTPADLADLAASEPLALHVVGRTVPDGDGFRHQWPGIYAEARFEGPEVVAAFDDASSRYRIVVDGTLAHIVDAPGRAAVRIGGLGPGPHQVRLEKLSESFSATGLFRGFFVARGTALEPPPARPLQVEFIGDSDMAGYGVTSDTRDCSGEEVRLRTDTQATYGALVARHLGADYQINAVSGIGLVRNYEGIAPETTMAGLYPRVLTGTPAPWEDPRWSPGLIVIALGSNDFGTAFGAGERWSGPETLRPDFEAAYLDLLRSLRARHPSAHLLLVVMDGYGRPYEAAHDAVAAAFRAEGGTGLDILRFPPLAKTACNWHPSRADHQAMAETLAAHVDARLPDLPRE